MYNKPMGSLLVAVMVQSSFLSCQLRNCMHLDLHCDFSDRV